MKKTTNSNSVKTILLCFAALWAALGFDYLSRYRSLPMVMRYIPKESGFVLYTLPVETLWKNLAPHHQRISTAQYDKQTESDLWAAWSGIVNAFNEQEVPIENLESLSRYGFDIKGEVGFGAKPDKDNPEFILALPAINHESITKFLSKLYEAEVNEEEPLIVGSKKYIINKFSLEPPLLTAMPDSKYLLLATSRNMLEKAIENPRGNLSYHRDENTSRRNQAKLNSSVRHPELSLFAFWRFTNSHLLEQVAVGVGLSPERISLSMRVAVDPRTVKILGELAAHTTVPGDITNYVKSDTEMLAAIKDSEIPSYFRFIRSWGDSAIREEMAKFFGGILIELEQANIVSEIKIAGVGYESGLPKIVIGIRGKKEELEAIKFTVQKKKRLERDETITSNALENLEEMPAYGVLFDELLKQVVLIETKQSLWGRYVSSPEKLIVYEYLPSDFSSASGYRFEADGFQCDYLLPAVTKNDIELRIDDESLEELDRKTLFDDTYRFCTVLENDTLWIATDGLVLKNYLQNTQHIPVILKKKPNNQFKARFYFDMDKIITEGLLNPETAINRFLDEVLMDFREYNQIVFDVKPSQAGNELLVRGEITDER